MAIPGARMSLPLPSEFRWASGCLCCTWPGGEASFLLAPGLGALHVTPWFDLYLGKAGAQPLGDLDGVAEGLPMGAAGELPLCSVFEVL